MYGMLAMKHFNKAWLKGIEKQDFIDHTDFILGPKVYTLTTKASTGASGPVNPPWSIVLDYEFQIREKAFELVREQGKSFKDALELARTDGEVRNLHFLTPVAMDAAKGRSNENGKKRIQETDRYGEPVWKKQKGGK